jgi:uncharacterized protein YtpQ (UPF0354 family)
MGFLKNIFGGQSKEQQEKVEKDLERIKSADKPKVYPIFKPGNWVGIKYGSVFVPFIGPPGTPDVVIGYGYDAADNFVFYTKDMLQGRSEQELRAEAHANLEAYPVKLEKALEGQVLCTDAKDFSAEKILSPAFMKQAQEMLGADELLVSIARRRCLLIVNRKASNDVLSKFVYLHNHTWKDDSHGNAPITDLLFVVQGGEIKGVVEMKK